MTRQRTNPTPSLRFWIALCLSFLFGCSDTGPAPESSEPLAPGRVEEALSPNERCDTIDPHKSYTSSLPTSALVTSASYNPSGCSKAYLIDVETYSHSFTAWDIVEYGDTVPGNRTDCERSRVGVYLWKLASGGTTYLGNQWRWGTWTSAGCRLPSSALQVDFPELLNLTGDLRIAASARLYDSVGSSTFTTKKLRALRVNAPVNGVEVFETGDNNCLTEYIDFNRPSSTYRGRTVANYVLRRNGAVVAKKPPESSPIIQIADEWFTPRSLNGRYRYTVSVETDRGDESPPSAWVTGTEGCPGPGMYDRIAVIPLRPRSTPTADVISPARLDDIMNGDGAGTPSIADFFATVSHGQWTPDIRVHPTVNLSRTIDEYRSLFEPGLTMTQTPSWMPECRNEFSCACMLDALPTKCSCTASGSTITLTCEYYMSTTNEDEAVIADLKDDFPEYRDKTAFAFVWMGVPGGGVALDSSAKLELGAGRMLAGNPFATAADAFVHEMGHILDLRHTGSYHWTHDGDCDLSNELFGSDPFRIGTDCAMDDDGDAIDTMASGNRLRPYNQFSRWILGWIDNANVSVYRPLTDSSKLKTQTLYADPTGTRDGLILVELDDAGSALLIEYRNNAGYFDPDFTGADDDFEPGVYVTFRPGRPVAGLSSEAQTFGQYLARPIRNGETVKLEDTLGITLEVSSMTAESVRTKVTWR